MFMITGYHNYFLIYWATNWENIQQITICTIFSVPWSSVPVFAGSLLTVNSK